LGGKFRDFVLDFPVEEFLDLDFSCLGVVFGVVFKFSG
jgi:hypothetical protein